MDRGRSGRRAAADLPKAPVFSDDWQLGTPDVVIATPRAYHLAPGETDVFRNLVLPVSLPAGRFVRAVEFRPGSARAVHHAVISLDRTRTSRRRDGADGQPGYDGMITQGAQSPDGHFLGWTPGRGPIVAPDGHALAARSRRGPRGAAAPAATDDPRKPSAHQSACTSATRRRPDVPLMIKLGSKAIDIPAGEAQLHDHRRVRAAGRRGRAERLSARALPRQGDRGARHAA